MRKQLQAYSSGDDSEATKATVQKLKVSLDKAEKSLKESEYERYIQDMEKLYDDLVSDTETWITQRLDDTDKLISESIDATNKNAETISNTIHEASNAYGYKLSDQMETIWDYEANAIDGVCTIVTVYGDILKGTNENIANNITTGTTNVVTAIGDLNVSMQSMITSLNNMATANANSIAQLQSAIANAQNSSYGSNNNASSYNVSVNSGNGSSNTDANGSKDASNTNDKDKNSYFAYIGDEKVGDTENGYASKAVALAVAQSEVNKRAEEKAEEKSSNASGSPAVQIYNNVKKATVKELSKKVKAYASGTTNAKKGWSIVGEEGNEIIIDKDGNTVLTLAPQLLNLKGGEQVINGKETSELLTSNLMPLSADQLWGNIVKTPSLPNIGKGVGGNVTYDVDKVELVLPNVKDYDSLVTEMQHDKRFERIVQSMTTDRLAGKGSLSKYKF